MKRTLGGLLAATLCPLASFADVVVTPADGSGFDGFYQEVRSGESYDGGFVNDPGSRDYNQVRRYGPEGGQARHYVGLLKFDLSGSGLTDGDLIGAHLTNQIYSLNKGTSTWSLGVFTGDDSTITSDLRYDAANPLIADDYVGEGDPDLDFAEGAVTKLLEFSNSTETGTDDVIGAGDAAFLQVVKDALAPGGDQTITFVIYYEGAGNSAEYLFVSSEAPEGGPRLTLQTVPEPFLALDPPVAFSTDTVNFSWYAPPGATNLMIQPEVGDVSGDTNESGVGALAWPAPAGDTTYTFSYDFEGSPSSFMASVEVVESLFDTLVFSNNAGSFAQDADLADGDLAFTDRDYVWSDLPDMLLGGQSILLSMAERPNPDLQIELSPAADSTLFLLIDNRVGDPDNIADSAPTLGGGVMDWVIEAGFIDTGLDAMVDTAPCSIFFLQVAASDTVTLLAQNDGTSRVMYSPVLVTPAVMPTGFGAAPNRLLEFSSTSFHWAVPPGSTNVMITPDVGDVTGDTDAVTGIGSVEHMPTGGFGTVVYTLSYDPPGEATVTADIDVLIDELVFDFTVTPELARVGTPITLAWTIPPISTNVSIIPDPGVALVTDPVTGMGSITIDAPNEDTDYELNFSYDGFDDFLFAFFTLDESPAVFESVVASGNGVPVTINPSRLFDDVLIYSDRTHTWLGTPDLLEDAQLVQFGNNDKNNGSLVVDVTAAADATFFLLVDNRVGDGIGSANDPPTYDPPTFGGVMDWVLEQGWVDTGLDIGSDENNDASINTFFSVFYRQVAMGETVTFYEQADGDQRVLYNIAGITPQVSPPTPFMAAPSTIDLGQDVTLEWSVPAGSTVGVDPIGDVTGDTDGSGNGSTMDTPGAPGTAVYTLTSGPDESTTTNAVRVYVTVNDTGGPTPPPVIGDITVDPASGAVSFSWPAPDGVTDPAELTDTVERSSTLVDDWAAAPEAQITIVDGTVQFTDPSPPAGKAFYRVNRP